MVLSGFGRITPQEAGELLAAQEVCQPSEYGISEDTMRLRRTGMERRSPKSHVTNSLSCSFALRMHHARPYVARSTALAWPPWMCGTTKSNAFSKKSTRRSPAGGRDEGRANRSRATRTHTSRVLAGRLGRDARKYCPRHRRIRH